MSSMWRSRIFCVSLAPSCKMATLKSKIWVRFSVLATSNADRIVLDKRFTIVKKVSVDSMVRSSAMPFASSSNFSNLKNIGRTVDHSRSFENNGSKTWSDLFTLENQIEKSCYRLSIPFAKENKKKKRKNFVDSKLLTKSDRSVWTWRS